MIRSVVCAVIAVSLGAPLFAQQPDNPPQAQTPADNGGVPVTLMHPAERANYVNIFAFVNGIYDGVNVDSAFTGPSISGAGFEGGGGITANHDFATGTFSLGYRGAYHTETSPLYPQGTEQTLNFLFRKLLTRRLTFSLQENAGIYPLGSTFLQPTATTESNGLQTTPFASKTRFSGTTAALSYQQTRRLSYEFTGTFSLLRYNSPVAYGNQNISPSGSVLYRLTRHTTLSGTYQYSSFLYQHDAGTANSNTGYATLSHNLLRHWTLGISAGATYTIASGTAEVPVEIQIGPIVVPVFVLQHYSQKTTLPYVQGSVAYNWRRAVLSVSGGQGVTPGNGYFLASRNIGVNGVFSYSRRRSNFSLGGYWSRLTSLAYASSETITTSNFQGSYAYNLVNHLGMNLQYEHLNFGNVGAYGARSDNRVTFGLYFSSKDIPVALF